jgi:hypothetical protein
MQYRIIEETITYDFIDEKAFHKMTKKMREKGFRLRTYYTIDKNGFKVEQKKADLWVATYAKDRRCEYKKVGKKFVKN